MTKAFDEEAVVGYDRTYKTPPRENCAMMHERLATVRNPALSSIVFG